MSSDKKITVTGKTTTPERTVTAPSSSHYDGFTVQTDVVEAGASLLGGNEERYELGEEHDRGGLGRIVNAYDKTLARPSVVKELLSGTDTDQRRFAREALITAQLQHPAIVPVHDAGVRANGQLFYAMKKVDGRSLKDVLRATTSLDERLALIPKVLAVAEAVAYAHSRSIIHRDLKPSNVMIGEYGETVVIDWGLAKHMSAPDVPDSSGPAVPATLDGCDVTKAGQVLGTPAYMPPEQARGEDVDPRADVYSLGAILYHVLAGRPPHDGPTTTDILRGVLRGQPSPLRHTTHEVPEGLVAIVKKAMAHDADERYQNAGELSRELEAYQTRESVGTQVTASMRATTLKHHPLWREFFTGLGSSRAPMNRLRTIAWLHLLVVTPFIYLPVGLEATRGLRQVSGFRGLWGLWLTLALIGLVANLCVVGTSRFAGAKGRTACSIAWYLTSVTLLIDVACTLLSTYPIGIVNSAASFYLVGVIVLARLAGDFKLGLLCLLAALAGYLTGACLEIFSWAPVHPAFPSARMPYYELGVSGWAVVVPSSACMVLLFAAMNYAVNQSLKLHRYLTDSVLRKYLPSNLVDRAARGDLSQTRRTTGEG